MLERYPVLQLTTTSSSFDRVNPILDQFVVRPAGGQRHALFVCHLKCFHRPEDFIHISPHLLGIVKDKSHFALWITDKHSTDGVRPLAGVEHS